MFNKSKLFNQSVVQLVMHLVSV